MAFTPPSSQEQLAVKGPLSRRYETTFGVNGGAPITTADSIEELTGNHGDNGLQEKEMQKDEEFLKALRKISQLSPKIVELPIFGDGKLTITQFLNQFQRASEINGWNEQQMANILPSCLTRRALLFYNTLAEHLRRPYAVLVKQLKSQFHSPETLMECRNALYTQKQGNTPLHEYLEYIEGLFEELGTPDVSKIDILIANLKPSLSYHLQTKQLKSYHEAVKVVQLRDKIHPPREDDKILQQILDKLSNLSTNKREITNNQVDVPTLLRNNRMMQQQLEEMRSREHGNLSFPNSTDAILPDII